MTPAGMVLGYDVRERWCPLERLWPAPRRQQFLLRTDVAKPLSADVTVWPGVFADPQLDWLEEPGLGSNGVPVPSMRGWVQNLWQSLAAIVAALPEHGGPVDIIAVTSPVPWHFAVPVSEPPGLDDSWDLLGYDVVDGWLLSGLMNCGYEEHEVDTLRSRWARLLNAHHLFGAEGDAAAFVVVSDARVREHAPFRVCGLWRLRRDRSAVPPVGGVVRIAR